MKIGHIYYVYIVQCADNSYYTGLTNNIERRIAEHNAGIDTMCYTYSRRPVKLLYTEDYKQIQHAISREKQLKGWTRKKKEALINNTPEALPLLSSSNNKKLSS